MDDLSSPQYLSPPVSCVETRKVRFHNDNFCAAAGNIVRRECQRNFSHDSTEHKVFMMRIKFVEARFASIK